MAYKKLLKHKRKPRKETSSFSKNNTKTVYTYGDGSTRRQSHISGEYATFDKKGRLKKR